MNGIALLLSLAAVGVDYGWQPGPDGQLEYIVQIEPSLWDAMRSGREIASEIHPDARGVRRFRIRVGNDPLPRVGAVAAGATPTRQLNPMGQPLSTDQAGASSAAGGLFPYAEPSRGILNLPPPPAMIGPDGKASVLVRPGDNALPGAGASPGFGGGQGFDAPGGSAPPQNPADATHGFSVPAREAWDGSGPRVDLPGRLRDIEPRDHHSGVDLCDLPPRSFHGRFLLRVIQPEDRIALFDRTAQPYEHLGHSPVRLRQDRHCPEEKRDVRGRRMIIEDHRDQTDREDKTGCDAPTQFEPDRVESDLLAQALSLHVPPEEVIRQDCQH